MNLVVVTITDKRAIYVDGTRITHRGTKWGIHHTIESFDCPKSAVVKECENRGYHEWVKNIDDHEFITPHTEE